jgi:tRNA threonylcarbamoyladenosine biosynthesis protein TsaB
MSLILNIDTATEIAHVSIARDGFVLQDAFNNDQKNHAGFLQSAIKKILQDAKILITEIDAVAVTEGPGSYTGIRIGMASAKGLCYALNKPLITINTLEAMANSAVQELRQQPSFNMSALLCPMIDARRMEVFTAVYDIALMNILMPSAVILDNSSFKSILDSHFVNFFGSGSKKWKVECNHKNAFFPDVTITAAALSSLSINKFNQNSFTSIAYSEPLYIKEFYINT